jgi:hypothetical protein
VGNGDWGPAAFEYATGFEGCFECARCVSVEYIEDT